MVFNVFAQNRPLNFSIKSRIINKDGVVEFIKFDNKTKSNFKEGSKVLQQFLTASEAITFVKLKTSTDKIGMTHEKYQEYYNGIPVEFGVYNIHLKGQNLSSINGDYYPVENINTTPSISALNAITKAKEQVNAKAFIDDTTIPHHHDESYNGPQPTLVIFPKLENVNSINRLAYKLDIYAKSPLYRADVYVDAHTGEVIFENNQIHEIDTPATGTTLYNGVQNFTAEQTGNMYRLRQASSSNGIHTLDLNNVPGGVSGIANANDFTSPTTNFTTDANAVQAHWGTEQTYNYYLTKHNRNSYDDNGGVLKSYVNFGGNNNSLANAFWLGNAMYYNNGNGNDIGPMVSLDIVGHEISHGVIRYSANLIYTYQSGALNESFADIFGEMVEHHALGTNDWLLGLDVHINQTDAFRSMSDPKSKNNPDTYQGQYWHTAATDNFGVHKNSGVQNKWFYLLSEGGTGTNDNNYSYSITGIGMTKAAQIAYRNLTVYLTSTSNFFDARNGAIQAAEDLFGVGSTEANATIAAWAAVGVNTSSSSDIIPPTVPLNLVAGSTVTEYNVDLTWNASTDNIGVVGYNIYRNGSVIATSPNTNHTVDDYMPNNTLYNFEVVAFDVAGNISGLSNTVSVWLDTIEPSDPTNLSSSNTTTTSTELSWTAATDNFGIAGYNLYVDNNLPITLNNTTYSVTGLTPGTTYSFKVTAVDTSGNESDISNIEQVTTLAPCADGNVTLSITLDFNPEETSWDIKNATNTIIASGGNYLPFIDANTTKTYNLTLGSGNYTLNMNDTFGDGIISPGGYTLESNVLIASGGFTSIATNTVSTAFCIDAQQTLSNPNFELNNEVKVITKKEAIKIEVPSSLKLNTYTMYAISGQQITTGSTLEISTQSFTDGVYILELIFNKGPIIKKIVIK